MAVTAVSNSLMLGGWMSKVSKNGDKNRGGGGGRVGDNNISTFCPTVLDKKCHFHVYSKTHLCIHLIKEAGCMRLTSSHMILL